MNNDKQYSDVPPEVMANIDAQLKPFFDDMKIAIERVQREIAEINSTEGQDKNDDLFNK